MPEKTPTNGVPAGRQPVPAAGARRPELRGLARRTVVVVLVTLLLLAVAVFLWYSIHVLLMAFAGVLLALFLNALSDWAARHTRLRYGWALTLVVVVLLLLTAGLFYLLAARLTAQATELSQKLPQSLHQIKDFLRQFPWGKRLVEEGNRATSTLTNVSEFTRATGLISGVAGFLEAVVVIFFVGVFGAAEPGLYRAGVLHLAPPRTRPRVAEALDALAFNLRWWLLGQVVLMVLIGATTTVSLWAIGIPLALVLGLIAGTLELVPYVGPWLSAVPAVLVALLKGPWYVVGVLGLYLCLHILEGYVLAPLIQRRAVLLPPALTLVMQVLLGELLGLMGLFVAAPLTVCGVVLLKMLYVEDTLGDEAVNVPGEPGNENKPALKSS